MALDIPAEVEAVFQEFRVCEFSSVARDGTPITWPTVAVFEPDPLRFILTTAIGLPDKAFRIRRNPRVSLLFSDPTASGLSSPPAVLVQGDAVAPDEIVTSPAGLEAYWRDQVFSRQPASKMFSSNGAMRKLMDWYYMRMIITVTPVAISWWPKGDFSRPAQKIQMNHVE